MTNSNKQKYINMTADQWTTHVRYEIIDATEDMAKMIEIFNVLSDMERLDLIPDTIASELFNLIGSIASLYKE